MRYRWILLLWLCFFGLSVQAMAGTEKACFSTEPHGHRQKFEITCLRELESATWRGGHLLDNAIVSYQIPAGMSARLYPAWGFQGGSELVRGSGRPRLAGRVSSVQVSRDVCFYKHARFQEKVVCLAPGELSEVNLKKSGISSIRVPPGMKVLVYGRWKGNKAMVWLDRDTDLPALIAKGVENDSIFYVEVNVAFDRLVCVYENERFLRNQAENSNRELCLPPGVKIDWYQDWLEWSKHRPWDVWNDRVASIQVPSDMQVALYPNNFSGPYISLTDMEAYGQLRTLGLEKAVTSIQVAPRSAGGCDQHCAVRGSHAISLKTAFGAAWNDADWPHRQVLMSFNVDQTASDFQVKFPNNSTLELKSGKLTLQVGRIPMLDGFALNKRTTQLSLVLDMHQENGDHVQLIETAGTEYLFASPLLSLGPTYSSDEPTMWVNNRSRSKVTWINKTVLAVEKEGSHTRMKRGLAGKLLCFGSPLLAFFNYIVQGSCNQPEQAMSFFKKIAGSAQPLPPSQRQSAPQDAWSLAAVFGINDWKHPPLSTYAAARTCRTSIRYVLSKRKPRGPDNDCIYWTLEIVTAYTLLFGSHNPHGIEKNPGWSVQHFESVIRNILTTGSTGYAVSDTSRESELIASVQAQERVLHDNGAQARTAFSQAQYLYEQSVIDNIAVQPSVQPLTPLQVQHDGALGEYQLDLTRYTHQEVVPRVYNNGVWQERPGQTFEADIIDAEVGLYTPERRELAVVLAEWERDYIEAPDPEEDGTLSSHRNVINVGRRLSALIPAQYLKEEGNEDAHFVVVRFAGRIVCILVADTREGDNSMTIQYTLTEPRSTVEELWRDGAVRGAGTFAKRFIAQYAKAKGVRVLISRALSKPSALINQRMGFIRLLRDELYS